MKLDEEWNKILINRGNTICCSQDGDTIIKVLSKYYSSHFIFSIFSIFVISASNEFIKSYKIIALIVKSTLCPSSCFTVNDFLSHSYCFCAKRKHHLLPVNDFFFTNGSRAPYDVKKFKILHFLLMHIMLWAELILASAWLFFAVFLSSVTYYLRMSLKFFNIDEKYE